ncbi:protein TRANSPARENT TESTA 9-like isoform X2 [Actinidia eriantha]|uniref:protein TRANSPARENT TESTA 9-like isoform X2 n=1 Tax=Actinidia eriantha TaxID=165200 RepID=UPI00258B8B33|nr:protein TRANSPARENT TESTA 9-like isoform X2 [Actinidia eriantha]
MWFSFWRSRDRFSLNELRYLTDQLMKVQIVNEVNKDFVIEALRSIAEVITYGDQHDSAFFEYFMEKQVMGEFVRILKISRTVSVSLQLLQTMSIMIQNLKSEHAIYYMFSNEHINYLITYSFDFRNEELLSYYISFLRAISGKLNKNTISLLVKTRNDEVVAFPLYVEAIKFAFHEESMVRTAVRALTLNVYHVGDECVNKYVSSAPHADYFLSLVKFFQERCISLNALFLDASKNIGPESTSTIFSAVDEIEDNLYYFSDVISAGIPDVGRILTDSFLTLLIFPFLLPSLRRETVDAMKVGPVTSMYLLCCILRIVKIKDLANTVAAALFCPLEAFIRNFEGKLNGHMPGHGFSHENQNPDNDNRSPKILHGSLRVTIPNSYNSSETHLEDEVMQHNFNGSQSALREGLLSYVTSGDDVQVLGSLTMLATLLQTKELDESMLDALGILPQRKQHKKLLLQALVGEGSGEEQLFSSESSLMKDGITSELESYLRKLKDQYGLSCSCPEVGVSPRVHRFQVLDALVSLFCRSNISAETLWDGGWLLRQLLPYSEAEFSRYHLKLLKESYKNCISDLIAEARGTWSDLLITVLCEEWRKCKRAIEASSPRKEPKCLLFPSQKTSFEAVPGESSFTAGERMCELIKVFVLLHQVQIFSIGGAVPDEPLIHPSVDGPEKSRAITAGLDALGPKPGTELKLVDAVPCRISFERGKERHFFFLAISVGTSGWVVLAEELPLKQHYGVVRVTAPLAGCNPRIDDKHSRWLHLRVRPSTFPFMDSAKYAAQGKLKTHALVDGRWTLAFRDEDSCKSAVSMITEERNLQNNEVERRLNPLLDLGTTVDLSNPFKTLQVSSSRTRQSNSL